MMNTILNTIYYVLGGVVAILVGVFATKNPQTALNFGALLFAACLAARGLKTLFSVLRFNSLLSSFLPKGKKVDDKAKHAVRSSMLMDALFSAILGVLALVIAILCYMNESPKLLLFVVYVIGFGFLSTGIISVITDFRIRSELGMAVPFAGKSIINIILGIVLLVYPVVVGETLVSAIGYVFIGLGALSVLGGVFFLIKLLKAKKTLDDATVEYTEIKAENKE